MNILICGLGSIGRRHLKVLKSLGDHHITALRSGRSGISVSENEIKPDDEVYSINDLKGVKIDAALITNPTSHHIQTATEIAKMGIPMFIEKPLGKNLNGIDELSKIVIEKNIPVSVGYNMIFHPGIIEMKKNINDGKIGKVISAKAQFGTYMPGWHPYEDYKISYAADPQLGGGVVLTSIHEQNYLTDFFGTVTEVKAMEVGGDVIGINSEEGIEVLMKHKTGVVSNIHLNFFQKPYYRNCQIIGTEGTLYWDFMIPEVRILKKESNEIIKTGDSAMELLDTSYRNQMMHFLETVRGKEKPLMSLEKGIEDMKTALKILKEIGRN
ncbi:MAG: Gfo/Idh/MocA family oxidoreductase [Ignavibacteria bacterium]|nr:Gfo/Idh/MocA family oxidoreductase [Ignavibacteria bacterium]